MPDDAIRHVFNDRTANMSITVLNLTEASTLLRTINRRDIKDVRAIDLDLALVLENGHKIIISRGAVAAVNSPQLVLEFADGDVILGEVFEKLNHIEVPPDAAVTVTSKEIKRYGIKRVVKAKDASKDNSEEQADARPEIEDGKPAAALADEGALKQPADIGGMIQKSDLTSSSLNDSGNDKAGQAGSGGVSWPLVAGGLGLLAAAAGGGGGGGGSGGGAGSGSTGNAATPAKPPATLSGATALGPLNNATITAYDSQGNVIGKPVQIVNGRYSLVLDQSDYKGLILLAVRDNTPGVADNFADEATLRVADLGKTVLRSVVLADGSNQTINVTALTELAVLKAGLASGQTNLAASQIGAPIVAAANAAVSALFKVNVTSGALITTSITDAQGAAVVNPDFASNASVTARNYGAALKAIANLQQTDQTRYADQGAAIQKLADSLQFTDALATRLRWSDPVTQADLFNERLNALANDVTRNAEQRQQARTLLDSLQKLPDGSSVTDYLLQNHVGILEPTILIRNTTPGAAPWQAPAAGGTQVLDQDDLINGNLAVKAPPQSKVEVTLVGRDAQGQEITVKLPPSTADSNGIAVLRPTQAAIDLFKRVTLEQPVSARVTVSDGDNSRVNDNVWKGNTDVRVDLTTPPGLTDFAVNRITLVNDTFYNGTESLPTASPGNDDQVTSDAAVRVVLSRVLKFGERLEFQVATSLGPDNAPRYGDWFSPTDLTAAAPDSNGQVRYTAPKLTNSEGPVWIKAHILRTAAQSGVAQGSARELETPLRLTLDKTAPAQVQLAMAANRDDGVSNDDGIAIQSGVTLTPRLPFESGAEVHLRLLAGSGTDGTTLQLVHANGDQVALTPGSWFRWQSGDQLRLLGQTPQGNGKARLQVRQIDAAGNFTDSTQTFIADSTRVIEQIVLVASREQALNQAKAAVIAAQEAFDKASAADKAARQTALTAAQTRLQEAQVARDLAPEQAMLGLRKSDGTTRLSDLLGTPVDTALLPAILRAVAATGDPEQVNDTASLRTLVNNVVTAATAVLTKASVFGENDTNPALTTADFERLAIPGTDQTATLMLANAALKTLPASRSNTVAALRAIVEAAARVAVVADGTPGNTADAALPSAADYTTLGVSTALSAPAARVTGQVIDGRPLTEVATTAALETIAAAAQRVTQHAAGINLATPLTAQDFSALGVLGVTADNVARLLDTAAPVLDLDANTPGIQGHRSQSVTLDQATSGVPLIKGAMAAPVANDIAMVRLTLPGGNDASNDNLILGGTRFTTRSNIDFSGSLGGVNGVELHYVAGTRLATISRTGGGALDGLQVKAILESLRYSFAPPAVGRVIPIEVVDRASNVGRAEVVLSLDNIVPTQLSTTLLPGSQKAYGVAKMEDVFGNVFFPTTNPHNLSRTEGVAVALPPGFASAASFLAAMRGISAEWGGTAIVGNANASNPNLKSYTMFNQAVNPGQELAVMQQGGGNDVLGSWLSFTLQRQANKSTDDIFINHRGSFTLAHEDLYRAEAAQDKSGTGIDLANIGLLYQIDTGRANKTPTIQVGYDGGRASVGDVVALFEGNTLLARKVLTSADVGVGNKTVDLTVAQSLSPGEHDIVARYTDTAGNTVSGPARHVSVAAGGDPVTLTDLTVRSSNQAPASAQALNASENRYAVLNDLDTTQASGHTAGGPTFSGKVGGANAGDRYVVTIAMGDKVLAFDEVAAGDFAIRLPAGSLAPGLYSDLTITASRVGGSDPGQTTTMQGLKLGWYWAAQSAGSITGGNGNDDIALGATRYGAATFVQTGAGQDKLIVGSYGRTENLSATVSDFTVGVDKVEVFNQTITQANLSRFVTASAGANANDTRLVIDLDGAGAGALTYTLILQNVMYNSVNTASIFGL